MIESGADLARARKRLGLSMTELGERLRLRGSREQIRKRITEMETGKVEISGPVSAFVDRMLEDLEAEGGS